MVKLLTSENKGDSESQSVGNGNLQVPCFDESFSADERKSIVIEDDLDLEGSENSKKGESK